MNKVLIEQLLNTNYVKYNRLVEIVNEAFKGSNANSINVYIDLYSILKVLFSDKIYNIDDYTSVTACIVNMCAHYRDFFRTRYKTESVIYLVYSENAAYLNKQFYPEYNSKNEFIMNRHTHVKDMIKTNLELLNTLCPYLPDIHFINSNFEVGVVIYDLICRNEAVNNNPHLVITKDMYNYQLASMNNVTVLRPKKSNGEDISYYINKNNLYHIYLKDRKVDLANFPMMLNPGLVSLLMTLSSVTERNIKSLLNIKTAAKELFKAIESYRLVNDYNSNIPLVWNAIDNTKTKIGLTTFNHRFNAIDIRFQHSVYMTSSEHHSISLTNLYDPDTVRGINNSYFKNNPLDLNRL
ncbi:MAG: hypothetical protein ACRDD7_17080 [Peptostreptococcaceae bacterium]